MSNKKRILILQTGGTFAMKDDDDTRSPLRIPSEGLNLRVDMPELDRIARYDVQTLFLEDSSDLNPEHWNKMAQHLLDQYHQYDGFVIVHGTDTMAFTASYLSFAFSHLSKPVVLTGSQIPLQNVRSDARRNLINAVELACSSCNEVGICFNDRFLRGNRSTKMSIGDFDAFASPNYPPLAEIGLTIQFNHNYTPIEKPIELQTSYDTRMYIVKLFPGMPIEYVSPLVHSDIRCVIIEAFGSGNVPTQAAYNVLPFVEQLIYSGKLVIITSQAPYDSVDLGNYQNARRLAEAGAMSAGDMTIEATVTKMMLLLGKHTSNDRIREEFLKNSRGERSIEV